MPDDIDYRSIDIPAEKTPEDMSYAERRALLLEHIRDKGSPARISRTGMAQRFDVSASQISRDIDTLAEYIAEDLDSNRVTLQTWSVADAAISGLLEAGESGEWRAYREAFDVAREWQDLVAAAQPSRAHDDGSDYPPWFSEQGKQNIKSQIEMSEAEQESVEKIDAMIDQDVEQISDTLVED